jgi:hypothetical protein
LQTLYVSLGWNVVILLFYLPGSVLGAWATDYLGPKNTLAIGVFLQAIFGFFMSGFYSKLVENIGGFVVMCTVPSSPAISFSFADIPRWTFLVVRGIWTGR